MWDSSLTRQSTPACPSRHLRPGNLPIAGSNGAGVTGDLLEQPGAGTTLLSDGGQPSRLPDAGAASLFAEGRSRKTGLRAVDNMMRQESPAVEKN
jgi:hypothetical protein